MIKELEELIEIENCMETFFNNYSNEQIVLFGAGFSVNNLIKKLLEKNINIVAICDNDKSKYGQTIKDIEIMSLKKSIELFPSALYIISSHNYFWDIYNSLQEKIPTKNISTIDFECAHYFYGYEFKNYFIKNINDFETIYNLFEDDYSKNLFLQVLKSHFSGQRKEFDKSFSGNEDWYLFNSLLKPNEDSVYLDCGAYDGDTILLFNKVANNKYKKIFALEPDPTIQNQLNKTIDDNDIKNIEIVKVGAYNSKSTVQFEQSGVYSNILDVNSNSSKNNLIEIKVDSIDNLIKDTKVDIIKMDIEGAEYFAIQGAKNIIHRDSPKLAICLYHNYEDFLRIPLLINKMNPNYKFYIRHQSFGCTDTILFAVNQ